MSRRPYLAPAVRDVASPDLALLTVATTALDAIREVLDDDSDASGVALYNPRQTIARLREILKRSDEQFATVKT